MESTRTARLDMLATSVYYPGLAIILGAFSIVLLEIGKLFSVANSVLILSNLCEMD